ncbi:MAG: hypothetical protein IJB47_07685 [Oscillospiraceae bacterium]|nr:hypothetical protein [Oscillospiraceae bacterium]
MTQRVDVQYIRFYTDGSAARRTAHTASAISSSTGILPRLRKQRVQVIHLDPVALLSIAVAAVMLITMLVGLVRLQKIQKQTAQMEAYVEQLSQEHETLKQAYTDACDIEAVEKTALALGMIPAEDAKQIEVYLPAVQEEPEAVSLWNRIGTFLFGLFA